MNTTSADVYLRDGCDRCDRYRGLVAALVASTAVGACKSPHPTPTAPEPRSEADDHAADASEGKRDAAADPAAAVRRSCVISIDSANHTLTIDGAKVSSFSLGTLRATIGEWTRREEIESRKRYERWGWNGGRPSSSMVEVTDFHYAYDDRGFVFHTRNGRPNSPNVEPERMLLFFENERLFDNTAAPAVVPTQRGTCSLKINGEVVDPARRLVPKSVDYRTRKFELFGARFGPTSIARQIDGIYSDYGVPAIRIYLDGPSTQRPSYVEINPPPASE